MPENTNPIASLTDGSRSVRYDTSTLSVNGYPVNVIDVARRSRSQNGWFSLPSYGGSEVDEEVAVRFALGTLRNINAITFKVAKVPCNWRVEYLDENTGRLLPVMSKDGRVLSGTITEWARPKKHSPPEADFLQFDIASKERGWRRYAFDILPIRTSVVLITLDRKLNVSQLFSLPNPVAYSVGLKDVSFWWRIVSEEDLPPDDEPIKVKNLLGYTEKYEAGSMHPGLALDGSETAHWVSAPQPYADSVVPMYLDIRQDWDVSTGFYFDHLFLDPVWPGPRVNIYWSNDDSTGTAWFLSRRTATGTIQGGAKVVPKKGLVCSAATDRVKFQNVRAFEIQRDWAIGCVYVPSYGSNVSGSTKRWLWQIELNSGNGLGLCFDPVDDSFKVIDQWSNVLASFPVTFASGSERVLVLGYSWGEEDPDVPQGWYLHFAPVQYPSVSYSYSVGTPFNHMDLAVTGLSIGGNIDGTDQSARGTIRHFWIRNDTWSTSYLDAFMQHPYEYVNGIGSRDRSNGHYRCMFKASFWTDATARFGPDDGWWEAKEWTPIPRDYTLHRDLYQLPGVKAKYLKLEFTNLVKQPFSFSWNQTPVLLEHRAFPDPLIRWYEGLSAKQKMAIERFGFSPVFLNPFGNEAETRTPPVPQRASQGITTSGSITRLSTSWSSSDDEVAKHRRHRLQSIPIRFMQKGRHQYAVEVVRPEKNEAYFVGLKNIILYRRNSTSQNHLADYIEEFEDNVAIAYTNMTRESGYLYATQQGQIFRSERLGFHNKIRAVQFAAVTSDWWSRFTNDQILLRDVSHLQDSANTRRTMVLGQYSGTFENQVMFAPITSGAGAYGTRTKANIFINPSTGTWDSSESWDMSDSWDGAIDPFATTGARVSAFVRIMVPDGGLGTYAFRLYTGGIPGTLVAQKVTRLTPGVWHELSLAYVSSNGHQDWTVEILQTDTNVDEPFVIAALGIFIHSVHWEISEDSSTWYPILHVNNPNGYLQLSGNSNNIYIRATAIRPGATISAYHVVPVFFEPQHVRRRQDDEVPWGASESEMLRSVAYKPMFRQWSSFIPQRFAMGLES